MEQIKNTYKKNKVLINNIIGSYFVKGLSLLISFLTLPSYIKFFNNNEVLGVWFTLLSVLQWIIIFDLGLGNGLRNKIVPYLIAEDHLLIKRYVSSSYYVIGIISVIAIVIGTPIIFFINWNEVFNISNNIASNYSLRLSVSIVYIGIAMQFFLKTILSILYAMKKVALSNFIALLNSILILLFIELFKTGNVEVDLLNLSIAKTITMNLPLLIASIYLFRTKLAKSRPSIFSVSYKTAKDVIKLGGNFFYIQIILLILNSTNELIISWLFGPSFVVEYLIYYRLFYLSVTFFSIISNPLWSEISELFAKNNLNRIRWIYKRIIYLVCITIIINTMVVLLMDSIVKIWLGPNTIVVNYFNASVFVLFCTITIYNMSLSVFTNASNNLKNQVIFFSVGAIIKLPILLVVYAIWSNWIIVVVVTILTITPYSIAESFKLRKILQM